MSRTELLVAGLGLGLLILLLMNRQTAANIGASAGGAVIDLAGGAASGAILGIGDSFGLPRTELDACEQAKAEGRTWDASFACPAGNFIKYLFS